MAYKDNKTKFIVKGQLSEQFAEIHLRTKNPSNQHLRKLKDDLTDSGLEMLFSSNLDNVTTNSFLNALLQIRGILSVLEIDNEENL